VAFEFAAVDDECEFVRISKLDNRDSIKDIS
jgi:hypothetical protein